MSSRKKVLKTKNGTMLLEVQLIGSAGMAVAVSYAVSSTKTPEVKTMQNLQEAERLFQEWSNS